MLAISHEDIKSGNVRSSVLGLAPRLRRGQVLVLRVRALPPALGLVFHLLLGQGGKIGGADPEPYLRLVEVLSGGDEMLIRWRRRTRKGILLVTEGCREAVKGPKLLVRDAIVRNAAIGETVIVDFLCSKWGQLLSCGKALGGLRGSWHVMERSSVRLGKFLDLLVGMWC